MDNLETLKSSFLFSSCPEAADEALLSSAVRYKKGERVYGREEYERSLGIVLEGEVTARPSNGTGAVLNVIGAGGVFGAAALFTPEKDYVSDVTATRDSLILFISEDELEKMFERWPVCAMNYIKFLTSRVRLLNARIGVYTGTSADAKLYTYLCSACGEDRRLKIDNMAELARSLDMGRTSLYRAMDELEKKNMIIKDRGEIILL